MIRVASAIGQAFFPTTDEFAPVLRLPAACRGVAPDPTKGFALGTHQGLCPWTPFLNNGFQGAIARCARARCA